MLGILSLSAAGDRLLLEGKMPYFRLVNYYDVPRYNDSYYEPNHSNHISGLLQNIVDKW
jgi:hypothetical protein